MQKILQIGVKDFMTGITVGSHIENRGLFTSANGINPFVDPFLNSSNFGLLQAGRLETNISGSVVTQAIVKIIGRNGTNAYALGDSGDFYTITLSNDSVAKVTNTGVNTVNGFILKDTGGVEKLYYINDSGASGSYLEIGTWDFATTFVNNALTSVTNLQPTAFKPIHYWDKKHWIGNDDRVAKVENGNPPTLTANAYSLDTGWTVTALEDDDYHLIIGASTSTAGSYRAQTKIIFWGGVGSTIEREYNISEPSIKGFKRIGGMIYMIAGNSLYGFNFSTPPIKLLNLDSSHQVANQKVMSQIGNTIIWGDVDINMFGSLNERTGKAYAVPYAFASRATTATALNAEITPGKIYVAGANTKLYTILTTAGGNTSYTVNAITHYFDLKDIYDIKGCTVIFGSSLGSGDSVTITLEDISGAGSDTLTFSQALWGSITRKFIPCSLQSDQLRLNINFIGTPKVKGIIIYGEKRTDL